MSERQIRHIYWFTYYNLDSPSVRYRAQYPLEYAKKRHGITSSLIIPGYSTIKLAVFFWNYIKALLFSGRSSLIVIQRVHSNFIYSNLLKLLVLVRRKQTVYDLDDTDYLDHDPRMIHFFARNCNSVSAGSLAIAKYLKQFNQRVFHITSPVPEYGVLKYKRNPIFTIGWIGGYSWGHKDSLYKFLFPAFKNIQFDCKLVMIGVKDEIEIDKIKKYLEDYKNISVCIPRIMYWNKEAHIQKMISKFDVGIATLTNNPIQLAKSGIKAKQYMNNCIPVICNDLPENNNVVMDGYNGFICKSALEFAVSVTAIRNMSDAEYWRYSQNAKKSTDRYSHVRFLEELEQFIV